MLYYQLGWDTVGHYRDFSDIEIGEMDLMEGIIEDTLAHDAFVVLNTGIDEKTILDEVLRRDPGYQLVYETGLSGHPLQYYVREKSDM